MDKKIELKVVNISSSQAQAPAFAMLLQETDGERQLPIIIGPAEAQAITFKINNIRSIRPLTHDLFASTLSVFDIQVTEVLIYKALDGVFYSHIFYRRDGDNVRVDSRTSDAIALAIRFNAPIYILESILEKECITTPLEKEEKSTNKDDLSTLDIQTLKRELKRAVKEENYEQASVLRDEIARRQ